MSIYSDLQKVSSKVLTDFDQTGIKLVHMTATDTGSPDEPSDLDEVVYDLRGVAKGLSFQYTKQGFDVATDSEVTTSVLDGVQPSIDDFIIVGGEKCKILKFNPVPQAGTPCVWKFVVRKGG